jgi:hypothetical protein
MVSNSDSELVAMGLGDRTVLHSHDNVRRGDRPSG